MADFGPPIHPPTETPSAAYIAGVTARLNREQASRNPYDDNSDTERQAYLDWEHGYWWAAHHSTQATTWLSARLK